MAYLILAGVAAVLAVLGRASRLTVLRELSAPMAVTAISAGIRALLGAFEVAEGWLSGASAMVFLALAWILVRATVMILFEWLLAQRLGVELPRLARQVVALLLYLVTATAVLKVILDIELTALVATSAVVTVVIGLALQQTLGNLFAGLALAMEQRLEAGTWVVVDDMSARVEELGWRSLTVRNRLGERLLLPNSEVANSRLRILGRGDRPVAISIMVGVAYRHPPDEVAAVLRGVAEDLPDAVPRPAPKVMVRAFADSAIEYECRLWTTRPWQVNDLRSTFLTRAWAALDRAGMEIPFPQRTLQFAAPAPAADPIARRVGAIAASKIFSGLPGEAVDRLAGRSRWLRFAPGEAVVREGEASRALYVVVGGGAAVTAAGRELGQLTAGEVFGEMAFLTGEPRRATVRARDALDVVEIDSAALTALLEEHHELADELAHRMASRRLDDHPDERPSEPSQRGGLVGLLRDRLLRLVGGGSS